MPSMWELTAQSQEISYYECTETEAGCVQNHSVIFVLFYDGIVNNYLVSFPQRWLQMSLKFDNIGKT